MRHRIVWFGVVAALLVGCGEESTSGPGGAAQEPAGEQASSGQPDDEPAGERADADDGDGADVAEEQVELDPDRLDHVADPVEVPLDIAPVDGRTFADGLPENLEVSVATATIVSVDGRDFDDGPWFVEVDGQRYPGAHVIDVALPRTDRPIVVYDEDDEELDFERLDGEVLTLTWDGDVQLLVSDHGPEDMGGNLQAATSPWRSAWLVDDTEVFSVTARQHTGDGDDPVIWTEGESVATFEVADLEGLTR